MQTDDENRTLYAERPELVMDGEGTPSVVFRYLGNSAVRADDPIGVIVGSGDLARVPINGIGVGALVQPLTDNGQINWQNASIYNGLADELITVGAIGPELDIAGLGPLGKSVRKNVPGVTRKGLEASSASPPISCGTKRRPSRATMP